MQLMAPYSPSQNGVAERMNCTLVELTRAMIRAQQLPKFLWEHAVQHAAYIRNRAYTRSIEDQTPYEVWFNKKPDVSTLQEFGTPVWPGPITRSEDTVQVQDPVQVEMPDLCRI